MRKDKIYIFDFDNTLIFTDSLNNKSYNYALESVDLNPIPNYKRITREILHKEYPTLSEFKINEIIELKQMYFITNLMYSHLNSYLFNLLSFENSSNCIIWTSASQNRVIPTLIYHNIKDYFKLIYYSNKNNLYSDIAELCSLMNCRIDDLIIFEDSDRIISNLRNLGVEVYDAKNIK